MTKYHFKYTPLSLARILVKRNAGIKRSYEIVSQLWENDRKNIYSYRKYNSAEEFYNKVLLAMDTLVNATIKNERDLVEKDIADIGLKPFVESIDLKPLKMDEFLRSRHMNLYYSIRPRTYTDTIGNIFSDNDFIKNSAKDIEYFETALKMLRMGIFRNGKRIRVADVGPNIKVSIDRFDHPLFNEKDARFVINKKTIKLKRNSNL